MFLQFFVRSSPFLKVEISKNFLSLASILAGDKFIKSSFKLLKSFSILYS